MSASDAHLSPQNSTLVRDRRLRDAAALEIVRSNPFQSIEDVLACMDGLDEVLDTHDGIRWFNFLYREVTREIHQKCLNDEWHHTRWLEVLDVEFAKLFFEAVERWLAYPVLTPKAWAPLFEKRYERRVSPLQFGLAGINAHINRDLPIAIVRALKIVSGRPPSESAREALDYTEVDDTLNRVEGRALEAMATGWIRSVSSILDPFDKRVAMATISFARKKAWDNAETYWGLEGTGSPEEREYVAGLDAIAAAISRKILIRTYSV